MFDRSMAVGSAFLFVLGCSGSDSAGTTASPGTGANPASTAPSSALEVPTGAQRANIAMDAFDIPAGGEFYRCQDFPNPFGQDVAIVQSHSTMTPGSHHMFVFRLSSDTASGGTPNLGPNDTKGPLGDCPNGGVEFHPFVHASQTPEQTFSYPQGIGQAFKSNETVRVAVHYLNSSAASLRASVDILLDYVPMAQVDQLAAAVFLNSVGLQVPPGSSVQGFSYQLPSTINLLGAAGHMHKWATHFEATATAPDATESMIYQTDTWDEPTAAAFSPAMPLAAGTTIRWACTYENTTPQTLTFGESAAKNEMCIFTGTYYPAPDGNGIYYQDLQAGTPN